MKKAVLNWIIGLVCPVILLSVVLYLDITRADRMDPFDRDYCEVLLIGAVVDSTYSKLETTVEGDFVSWTEEEFAILDGQKHDVPLIDASTTDRMISSGDIVYLNKLYGGQLLLSSNLLTVEQIRLHNEAYYSTEPLPVILQFFMMLLILWAIGGFALLIKK